MDGEPINGVTVLEEMPFDIVYKDWRNQRFPETALMEVDGVLTVMRDLLKVVIPC